MFQTFQQSIRDAAALLQATASKLRDTHHRYTIMFDANDPMASFKQEKVRVAVTQTLDDSIVILETASDSIYDCVVCCFENGIGEALVEVDDHLDTLIKDMKRTKSKWKKCSTGIELLLSKGKGLDKYKDSKAAIDVVARVEQYAARCGELAAALSNEVLPTLSAQATILRSLDTPTEVDRLNHLKDVIRKMPEELRQALTNVVPKAAIETWDEAGIIVKKISVQGIKGDYEWIQSKLQGITMQTHVFVIDEGVYRRTGKEAALKLVGEYLLGLSNRGGVWTQINLEELKPFHCPVKLNGYVYFPMLPTKDGKFIVRLKKWMLA